MDAGICCVQVTPSGEVMIGQRGLAHSPIAQNSPRSGFQTTPLHADPLTGVVLAVQVMPSGEVHTWRVPPALYETAQNKLRSGDQHMDWQAMFADGPVRVVHVSPSLSDVTILVAVRVGA